MKWRVSKKEEGIGHSGIANRAIGLIPSFKYEQTIPTPTTLQKAQLRLIKRHEISSSRPTSAKRSTVEQGMAAESAESQGLPPASGASAA